MLLWARLLASVLRSVEINEKEEALPLARA